MTRYGILPERVYVHTDAYSEGIYVSPRPLPAGPRFLGKEAEYVRADLHQGAMDALRAIRDRTDKEYDDEMIEDVVDLVDRVLYPDRQPPPIAAASPSSDLPKEG